MFSWCEKINQFLNLKIIKTNYTYKCTFVWAVVGGLITWTIIQTFFVIPCLVMIQFTLLFLNIKIFPFFQDVPPGILEPTVYLCWGLTGFTILLARPNIITDPLSKILDRYCQKIDPPRK